MERNSSAFVTCSLIGFVTLLGFIGISTVAGQVEYNEEIKEAWFEAKRGLKEPQQVYECVKRIQQVYASLNTSEISSRDEKRKATYDILFNAWNPTPDQCDEAHFRQRDHFSRYTLFELNIGNYWHHCEQKRIQVCEPVLEEQLKKEVDAIGEAKRQQVKLLVDSIKSECEPSQDLDKIKYTEEIKRIFTTGTLKYMEALEGPLSKSVLRLWGDAEDRFKGVYKRLVGDLCFMVFDTGRKQQKISKVIKQNTRAWKPTGLIGEWMEAEQICSYVFLMSSERWTFELLRETNRGKGLFGLGIEI